MTKTSPPKWRDLAGMIVFHGLRILEFILPPKVLRCVLYPAAAVLAGRDVFFRRQNKMAFHLLPATWPTVKTNTSDFVQIRIRYHLSRAIANWPDRLGNQRWRSRFSIQGNSLEEAVQLRRPIILVSAHFGPFHLGAYFLRALGFRLATFVGNAQEAQSASRRAKDRLSHFLEMPHTFSAQDNLRDVYRFLEKGNILRTAFDIVMGKMIRVPLCDRSVCFATGSIRLAAATGAVLIPYVISEREPWKFVLHLGQPVPPEFLGASPDIQSAAAHVVFECCQFFQSSPDEARGEMLEAIARAESHAELITT